ncbi:pyridoxal phosphate homeostasis protein [Anaeramoeba flamelloides]|uniref:Pyridoxal phosphate homeostasis protein n=1 Tax=Anaeramoeba flamelloides TaxID=1746091 RepID=A0AAV8AC85_9EUKA|nr:pyridoxal phosphate homeostasis protein [Anaeramoeba flamelloides]KAJ6252635.1 pyridoxal phosphate homeostasis protein [Anaeramoeba flamelloides]|eukprot:Anaeramoba_flamelloidesa328309_114.p1 GENE.a328309_114~~a328309_114.p1  ORF type:complete len:230 (+),score=59.90 a328309_114:26-715(+)
MSTIKERIATIQKRITTEFEKTTFSKKPTLLAVSKIKPAELVLEAYEAGHRDFGENYVKELHQKAQDVEKSDIRWHFIGHLQSNKAKLLCSTKNLYMMQTVHSIKIARLLNKHCQEREEPLRVMIQINTSGEENKSGCDPENCHEIIQFILNDCPNLKFVGIMMIGFFAQENDFKRLSQLKEKISKQLQIDSNEIELSMGMSNDYETAIKYGSTCVRVGSLIFGQRNYN